MSESYRTQLAAVDGLAASPGWAALMENLAGLVLAARAVTEDPYADERARTVAAARIKVLNEVVGWPAERAEWLRERLEKERSS